MPRAEAGISLEESMEIELGICGFTQNRIIKVSGRWISAECQLGISDSCKNILHRLADIHASDIEKAVSGLFQV
jgi:hypothetical protein